jgi:hypothetical protein
MPVQNVSGMLYVPERLNIWGFDGNLYVKQSENKSVYDFSLLSGLFTEKRDVRFAGADFYEKQPPQPAISEEPQVQQQPSRDLDEKPKSETEELLKKLEQKKEIRLKKGVMGLGAGKGSASSAGSADILAKGGFVRGIDAVLSGVGGLKGGGSGGVGRRGIAGIGYGVGSGSGFESGLLSIPVDISFEGSQQVFDCPLMKKGETPEISFYYRKTSSTVYGFFKFLAYLLILIAASFITRIFWLGWSKNGIIYGVLLPLLLSLLIAWFRGFTVSLDLLIIVPFLFFLYRCILGVVHGINKRSMEKRIRKEKESVEKAKDAGDTEEQA